MNPHLLILTHELDRFEDSPYLLREMARIWRSQGITVTVQKGTAEKVEASVAILHVDLTSIPDEYPRYLRDIPKVLNGRVTDISKRRISRCLLKRTTAYEGPVLVKTDLNCGGASEANHLRRSGFFQVKSLSLRERFLPWTWRAHLLDYRFFPSMKEVPPTVWLNPHLVVERFLPERSGEFYCLRTWVFFGKRETNSLSYSHQPVVKSANVVRREVVAEVPVELREMRKRLGFDYGKFDYGIVNGEVVLYDANPTPMLGGPSNKAFLERIGFLAEGIQPYLHSPSAPRP